MSKFCGKCGAELPDEAMFCTACGENFAVAPEAPATPENDFIKKIMEYKKFFLPGAIALGAIIIVIVLIVALSSSPKDAVKNYVNGTFNGDYDAFIDMQPTEVWEYMEKEYDQEMPDEKDFEEIYESSLEALEEEYGKDVSVSYKVTDKDELDEDDLKDIRNTLKDTYDISKKDVTAAYELDVELTIEGDDDEETKDATFIVYKLNGDWYVQDVDIDE